MVSTQAIDDKEQKLSMPAGNKLARRQLFFIRTAFIITWLIFSFLILIIALLININLMRPSIEAAISQSVHRNVKLGHLSWQYGWRGLSIDTSSMLISDRGGDPFIMARRCQIGFSILPLLLGKGQIAFVNIQSPLFMAVHLGQRKWNFDDLMVASPDIDFIQIQDGHVFVVDRQPGASHRLFPDTELNNLQIKLERAGNFTPAQVNVSFALAGAQSTANYSLNGKIWGTSGKPWWDKKCHFELATKRFTPETWQTISSVLEGQDQQMANLSPLYKMIAAIPQSIFGSNNSTQIFLPTAGQFDLQATADGIPTNHLKADLQLKADHLVISSRNNSQVDLPETQLTTQLDLKQNSISWSKSVIKIPAYDLQLNSFGNTIVTSDGQQNYQWDIIGLLSDFGKLNPLAAFVYKNILPDTAAGARQALPALDGRLFFDLHLNKANAKTDYGIDVRAIDINIESTRSLLLCVNQLINNKPVADNLFEKQCLEHLKLSKQAEFTGKISAKSGEGLTLTDCSLADDQMTWKISGQANESGNWHDLTISNKDMLLSKLSEKINHDQNWAKQVKAFLGLPPSCQLSLNGKAQIELAMKSKETANNDQKNEEQGYSFTCATIFNDVGVKTSEPHLDINHLGGSYAVGPDSLICKDLHFSIANSLNSEVEINAQIPANASDILQYKLHAKNINVQDFFAVLNLFHLDTKWLDAWHLSGQLTDIELSIKGSARSPIVSFTISPHDLVFTIPNLKPLIHATSGKIVYAKDVLSGEKVNLTSQNSKCNATIVIRTNNSANKLEKLHVLLDKADLNDLQSFYSATSSASPVSAYFANAYSSFTKKYQVSGLRGTISGVIEYALKKDKPNFSSLIDFADISFKCGAQKSSFQNLKGKANFTDNDLILHDTTGSIDDANFALGGRLLNYKDKSAQWHGEFLSQVTPDQLNNILALCSSPGQQFPLTLQGKKAVFVKLKSGAHNNVMSQSFTLSADPDAALIASMGNFNFYQPAKKMIINGSCNIDEQKLTWRNLNFDYGGSSINMQGSVSNFRNARGNNKLEPIYDLQIQTPDYLSGNTLGQIISYGVINSALTGQVKLMLSVQGTAKALSVNGKVFLLDLTCPDLYLNHIVGTVIFQPPKQSSDTGYPTAQLQLDKLGFGDVQLSQASGNLIWQADSNPGGQSPGDYSQIYLKNFIARIAQGRFTAQGHTDLKAKTSSLDIDVTDANLAQLWPQITSYQIKAIGLLNSHISMETSGSTAREFQQNMVGSGKVHIGQGSFSRLTLINARLNQANLLHQGIFGFNMNNLMQSVLPAKASEFNTIDSAFNLDNEVLAIRHILYDGKDIKFSAAGKANLALHNVDLDIAGVMPRVSNSILGGRLGELSREITLQKLLDGLTMHKLEKLPSLPLLGGMAGGPEIFTCRILAPYDQPKLISQSIQKSFRWLRNH